MTALGDPVLETGALDATALAGLVARREVSAVELTRWAVERVERANPRLNAVVVPLFERALEQARRIDGDGDGDGDGDADGDGDPGGDGAPHPPFAGVPYLLKDLAVELRGAPFSEGSRFLAGNVSTYDSELVVRLRRAGLVILGKTNTPEFGMVPACEPVLYGATRNPWDPERSTSGSSGGSAAAVASRMVPMAHGNDLGGSLRFPASACGLFGLKPTRARNPFGPEYGDVVGGWAVEHALTRSVRDSAALLDATGGPAAGDPYPAPTPRRPFAAEVGADPGRLRIAFSPRVPDGSPGHPDCVKALMEAVELCTGLGHETSEADLPGLTPEVGDAIGTVFNAATAWIVGYWIKRRGREPEADELEPVTRAFWEAGRRVSAADYLLAVEELQRFSRRVAAFLGEYDLWLTPTMSAPPPPLGFVTSTPEDPLRALHNGGTTVAYPAVVANITGGPAMSVPLSWNTDGLPIGVHFLGRFGDEATLFRLAAQLEEAAPWAGRTPGVVA
ncbi:amidase [Catenulispora subtropica]|uniref:Amidase n=1 Tax=Catenulispora subtropica TaxID=450798 RepID=A0ABP5DNC7_9ACTN